MKIAYKTEIHPNPEQIKKIVSSIGVCRFLYNQYVGQNLDFLQQKQQILSANQFDKQVNHELSLVYPWIKECGSKARKKSLVNAETAFQRYFQKKAGKPRFKKKQAQTVKLYFPKNNPRDLEIERHRIKLPTLGWVRLKEKGYLPIHGSASSCTIEQKANRFYVSVLFSSIYEKKRKNEKAKRVSDGIGIDLGIKDFVITSQGQVFQNINKTSIIKRTEKRLKRVQRALSRQYEFQNKRGEKPATKNGSNIVKNILRIQKIYQRLARMRDAYRAWVVSVIAKTKPTFITIEKLNVQGMKKNRHLAKSISDQGFYDFKQKLGNACRKMGIELREVALFYHSSKLCSHCGIKKVKLSLSERVFSCEHCGRNIDRDHNAAVNLMQASEYVLLP
ncbi:RNA-guided endonuclease InsQ/TnpB family protein [Shimazuella kribbensis]|uniref:RNA-guided endonuclease InsQ/TnpB family protein n=1 Tax=Shimazuella kribbensis TaxID=139808 RepID=UPI0003FB387C|nr:RNA-guided endonuclease TnpB family protein [Shimazuella kribbensis]